MNILFDAEDAIQNALEENFESNTRPGWSDEAKEAQTNWFLSLTMMCTEFAMHS